MPNTAISLFSGAGGCSLGFRQAGFDILLAVEKDADAVATYRSNFPETQCIHEDIAKVDAKEVLLEAGVEKGELTFLIGGPPCQGFSSAGAKFLDDPRNKLVRQYIRFLSDLRPKWFLMENVEGLLTAGEGSYFPQLARSVLDVGYSIRIHKLYSHWHGLPQKRKRVFIIGNSADQSFTMPPVTHFEGKNLIEKIPVLSIIDGISDLPFPGVDEDAALIYLQTAFNEYQENMRGTVVTDHWTTPLDGNALERVKSLKEGQTMKHLPRNLQHPSFQRRAKRRVMDGTPTEKRGGAPSGLKRLHSTEPCLTITSAAPREFVHPSEDRFLTIRECARVQSFPDSFSFCGSVQSKIQQIGNAIPPLVARTIAEHIMKQASLPQNSIQRGRLFDYSLTKANAMSPALAKVDKCLKAMQEDSEQLDSREEEKRNDVFTGAALSTQ